MAKILILYSSTAGHTRKICLRLQQIIEQQRHEVTVVSVTDASQLDLTRFDKVVIGASIHYGRHSPLITDFIEKNRVLLERKPSAFFSVNAVARKPEKSKPENNPYLQKFLRRITWKPKLLAVFAGKIDYPSYNFFDRSVIRLIMWMTQGPTDPRTVVEFTDWNQVERFGQQVCMLQ